MTSMPITDGQQLAKSSSKRKKLFYLCNFVKTYLNLHFSKISCEKLSDISLEHFTKVLGIAFKINVLVLPSTSIHAHQLLPLFHTLPTPSTKIPVPLPSSSSLKECHSLHLSHIPTPAYNFPEWVPVTSFASSPFCTKTLLRALKQAPSLPRMKQSNLATAGPVQEPQTDSHHLHPNMDEVKAQKHSPLVQISAVILLIWLLLIHILEW